MASLYVTCSYIVNTFNEIYKSDFLNYYSNNEVLCLYFQIFNLMTQVVYNIYNIYNILC